jgi:hypothetical protein
MLAIVEVIDCTWGLTVVKVILNMAFPLKLARPT